MLVMSFKEAVDFFLDMGCVRKVVDEWVFEGWDC